MITPFAGDRRGAGPKNPPGVADDMVLYHVLHPTNPDRDEWTQDYIRATAYFLQFSRDYGQAHLHAEVHPAAQYKVECLRRTEPLP